MTMRVFVFGVLQGRRRGLQPDLELLYAGAMFHDIGLTETYHRPHSLRPTSFPESRRRAVTTNRDEVTGTFTPALGAGRSDGRSKLISRELI
jgi:hypothetical protein